MSTNFTPLSAMYDVTKYGRGGKRQRYALSSSYFTFGPTHSFFFSFLTQNVMPYLGEGREGKGAHVTGEFGVVSEKNSLNFSIYH